MDNSKVGLLVTAGLLFLVFTLYMIGRSENLFGSTFTIKTMVGDVNGLIPGNNVRFMGMDVGTVRSIEMANDSAISITMGINNKMRPYIKKNSVASIGTDGLIGNMIVHIQPTQSGSSPVEDGDLISSHTPIEMQDLISSMNRSSQIIEKISLNLVEFTKNLNDQNGILSLLSDTVVYRDLKNGIADFRRAGGNTSAMTNSAKNMILNLEEGEGVVSTLFSDTSVSVSLISAIEEIRKTSVDAALTAEDLQALMKELRYGQGSVALLLNDTTFRDNIFESSKNIELGTEKFNQNMEALKTNFFFRGYFKRLEKKRKKEEEEMSEDTPR